MSHVTRSRDIIADMIVEDTENTPLWEVLVPTEGNDAPPPTTNGFEDVISKRMAAIEAIKEKNRHVE